MRRGQACWFGEDWRGAPIALLLRPFEIGFPYPAHLGLREAGAAAKPLPRCALGVGRIATVDQQLEAQRALAGVAQGESGRERQIDAGRIAADREPPRIDAEARPLACGEA